MTSHIPAHNESLKSTNLSWDGNLLSGSSHDSFVFKFDISSPPEKPLPAGFTPIGARARRLRENPDRNKGLVEAREWLAEQPSIKPGSFKQLRLAKGMSQQQLADLANTTQAQIARLESGTIDPQISTVCRLAKALEVESTQVFVLFAK